MLSAEAIKYFKENGYSFEQMEGMRKGLKELDNGQFLSEEEVFGNLEKTIQSHITANA